MLTDRGKLLLVAAVGLWLLARAFGIDEVSMAALGCLTLVGTAVVYTRVASARFDVRRYVRPTRLFFDDEGVVELEIRNRGRLPTALLLLEDTLPRPLGETFRRVLAPLRSREAARVEYTIRGGLRGRYDVGPAAVHLRDPFGIAQRRLQLAGADEVIVYPPVWSLPSVLPRIGRLGPATQDGAKPLVTSGDFANVREYVRGDDLRKVHWKSTAHRGKLMLKQEEANLEVQATLVLDGRLQAHSGTGPASTFEHAVAVTASAAFHLSSERRYALRLITSPFAAVPPTLPWELLLEHLAVIEPLETPTLAPLWRQLAKGVGGEGMLISVGPVPEPAELREMVRAGRGFGGRVAVIVAPHREAKLPAPSPEPALAALRGSGWRATVYRPGERLDEAWQRLVLRAPHAASSTPGTGAAPSTPAGAR